MTAPDKPLHERIAEYAKRPTHWNYEANALLREAAAELSRMEQERDARNKIDPVTRLHNLCDGLAEHRHESPYDEESWRLADEDNARLRAELSRMRTALEEIGRNACDCPYCKCAAIAERALTAGSGNE